MTATIDIHVYGRVSRLDIDRADDKSLNIQDQQFRDACDTLIPQLFAKRQGRIVGAYKDEGKSASRKRIKRHDFDRLIRDIENGQIKILMVLNLSRFSRMNHIDALKLHMKLHEHNVKLVSIDDRKIISIADLMSFMEVAFKSNNDHEYARTVGRNTLRGCLHSVRQGQAHVNVIPYGMQKLYITEQGQEVVCQRGQRISKGKEWKVYLIPGDDLEQKVIQRIFNSFVNEDISPAYIARSLNEDANPLISKGINGNGWCDETIRNILKNKHYNGKVYYGQRTNGEHIRTKKSEPVDAKEVTSPDPMIAASPYEPMIADDLFQQAQKKFERNKAANHRSRVKSNGDAHPLTGILKCSVCGRGLYTYNAKHPRYQCRNRVSPQCRWRSVSVDEMLPIILGSIDKELLKRMNEDKPDLPDDCDYRSKLEGIDARIEALTQSLNTCSIETIPGITSQIDALQRQRADIAAYIGQASQHDRIIAAWERWEALVEPFLIPVKVGNVGKDNPAVKHLGIQDEIDRLFNFRLVKPTAIRQLLHGIGCQVKVEWDEAGTFIGGNISATIDGAFRTNKLNSSSLSLSFGGGDAPMADVPVAELLRWVAKYGRFLLAGKITADEFSAALLDQLAAAPGSNPDLAAEVVAALPAEARPAMLAVVRVALAPGFRKPAWHYGGPGHRTEAERAAESAVLTERVRSWAAALAVPLAEQRHAEPGAAPS